MTGETERYVAVGAILFLLGAVGFLTRRNLILIVLSAETMLHGVSLTLVAFGRMHGTLEGQAFTIFILTVAACEAGLALALILSLYRKNRSLDANLWSELREEDLPPPEDTEVAPREPAVAQEYPPLVPAGLPPDLDGTTIWDDRPAAPSAGITGPNDTSQHEPATVRR